MADKAGGILARIGTAADTDIATDIENVKAIEDTLAQELAQRATGVIATDSNGQNATYEDVVNITDKGVLTGLYWRVVSTGDAAQGTILVTIDGGALTPIATAVMGAAEKENGMVSFNHRFNTSLRIQHQVTNNNSSIYTAATYTTD